MWTCIYPQTGSVCIRYISTSEHAIPTILQLNY